MGTKSIFSATLFTLVVISSLIWINSKQESTEPLKPQIHHTEKSLLPSSHPEYQTTFVEDYDSGEPAEDELEGVQCPIPMDDRVRNYTGIQCVYSSIETLGRWAECDKLINPPMTSRWDCKRFSGPSKAADRLNKIGVKFEQTSGDRKAGIRLIKKAMKEGRGCLFDVPGHAMVLCHYNEKEDVVRWIDNSDRSLRMQQTTVDRFHDMWSSWVLVIYAEPDLFPEKVRPNPARQLPIIDRNGPQGEYPKDYIPLPLKQQSAMIFDSLKGKKNEKFVD